MNIERTEQETWNEVEKRWRCTDRTVVEKVQEKEQMTNGNLRKPN